MPWKESSVQEQRQEFIEWWLKRQWPMTQLCEEFGVSEKTGYKWLGRFKEGGWRALADRSRAPRRHPNAMGEAVAAAILATREAHRSWGPRKLKAFLEGKHPELAWPAASAIGALLSREKLVAPPRNKRRTPPYSQPFVGCEGPNTLWCADFKGWFRTRDGSRCYPFTLSDAYSRYLLRCLARPDQRGEPLFAIFAAAFREYGLPAAIRTDNGSPFASRGLGGLSRLSVWWVKLGIRPERIAPASPQQNGRHERLHRTLEQDLTHRPEANRRAQQRAFDAYQRVYNEERPHEALDYAPPARLFLPSDRRFPLREPQVEYPGEMAVRRVRTNGEIRWRNGLLFVSEVLVGEPVGLRQVDDRRWELYFGFLPLAILDTHTNKLQPRRSLPAASPTGVSVEREADPTAEPLPPSGGGPVVDDKVLPMSLV